ncbi:MAG: Tim44 domain-containing protein [Methylocystis sp.]|nr:Tim44 domain-containing protein [Methylocystis sp.]
MLSFDPSILVFAALAVFVIWKLRAVLGVRTDREKPAPGRFSLPGQRPPAAPSLVPPPGAAPAAGLAPALAEQNLERWKGLAEPGGGAWAGLDAIADVDRRFSGAAFIDGARNAYEMIVMAFAAGDRDALHNLLAEDVFDSFAGEIAGREQRGEKAETKLVAIDSATVEDALVEGRTCRITVRFVAKLITARRNRAGEIIEGSPDQPVEIVDIWTFAHEAGARDPNWKLVGTESGN